MVEKVKYSVLKKIDSIEIRKYPEILLALVEGLNDDRAFGLLFNFISGNNKVNEKIKMTAPVINSEKIKMTSPVISKGDYIAFIMPPTYNNNSIPMPLDPNIKIKIEPERKLAVIRFSGYSTYNKIQKYEDKLMMLLKENNIKTKGDPLLMRYNSPFAPPFIRRNEVGIEVEID